MGTTPVYGWPYPELTPDPPDGPAQIKALATAIENTIKGTVSLQWCVMTAAASQPITGSPTKVPLTAVVLETPGLATLTNGTMVLNKAGTYVLMQNATATTNQAAAAQAAAVISTTPTNPSGTAMTTELPGNGGYPVYHYGLRLDRYPAGTILTMDLFGAGMGASPTASTFRLAAIKIGAY